MSAASRTVNENKRAVTPRMTRQDMRMGHLWGRGRSMHEFPGLGKDVHQAVM
jgi:hypothetical protein